MQSVLSKVYKRYSDKLEDFGDVTNTIIKQIEFFDLILNKLTTDNAWLVDRLSEIGKENELIKKAMKAAAVKETIDELDASASVLKNFEKSRDKLKQTLNESANQFPNTYSKLAHKYNNFS